jgi:hypothetical protein
MHIGRHCPCQQVPPDGHVPQSIKPQQPSDALPHATPWSAQVLGAQRETSFPAHTPWLHATHWSHVPQSICPPQPSSWMPQSKPCSAHVLGTQAEQGGPASAPQGPQFRGFPQPSVAGPQQPCCAHDLGMQGSGQLQVRLAPGGFVTAPQQPGSGTGPQPPMPQAITPEQPSEATPLTSPMLAHVTGTHGPAAHELHWPGVPPAPHTCPIGHLPQSRILPQPSGTVPQA